MRIETRLYHNRANVLGRKDDLVNAKKAAEEALSEIFHLCEPAAFRSISRIDVDKSASHQLSHTEIASDNP